MVMEFIKSQKKSYHYEVKYSGLGYVEATISSSTFTKNCLHYWPRGDF
jgi:hypothetical protein